MPILTKEVEVKVKSNTVEHYKSLGYEIPMKKATESTRKKYKKDYVYDFSKSIIVKTNDLPKNSTFKVEVLCDFCYKNIMLVRYEDYNRVVETTGSYVCKNCCHKKMSQTTLKKYGVHHYSQTKEYNERVKETCLKKYGVENPFQLQEVKEKISNASYISGLTPTSRQQFYIYNLYNMKNDAELNYPVKAYNLDICFPKEKLDIEIDFGGHNLSVKLGTLTQEEFNQKEIIRNNIIKREGYKRMRIISKDDKLPSDQILLQMLQETRQYFSNYPNHSWCEYNISTSTLRNAENKHGISYDFGKLRRIK